MGNMCQGDRQVSGQMLVSGIGSRIRAPESQDTCNHLTLILHTPTLLLPLHLHLRSAGADITKGDTGATTDSIRFQTCLFLSIPSLLHHCNTIGFMGGISCVEVMLFKGGRMHKGRALGIVIFFFLYTCERWKVFIYWEMECDGY